MVYVCAQNRRPYRGFWFASLRFNNPLNVRISGISRVDSPAVDTWSRSSERVSSFLYVFADACDLMFLPSAWRQFLTFFIRYPIRAFITKALRASRRQCHLCLPRQRSPSQYIMTNQLCTKILI